MQSKRATGWSAQRTLSPLTPPTKPLSSGLLDEACTRTPRQRHLMEQVRGSAGGEACAHRSLTQRKTKAKIRPARNAEGLASGDSEYLLEVAHPPLAYVLSVDQTAPDSEGGQHLRIRQSAERRCRRRCRDRHACRFRAHTATGGLPLQGQARSRSGRRATGGGDAEALDSPGIGVGARWPCASNAPVGVTARRDPAGFSGAFSAYLCGVGRGI